MFVSVNHVEQSVDITHAAHGAGVFPLLQWSLKRSAGNHTPHMTIGSRDDAVPSRRPRSTSALGVGRHGAIRRDTIIEII